MSHARQLRALLKDERSLQAPGVFDGLSALLVEQAGFAIAFFSGASYAFTRFGRPDLGLIGMAEVAEAVRAIRDRVALPLIVDADTGFGNALNVQRTVREFEAAGASAIQIEDQISPKRCGHMTGKQVIAKSEMVGKVKAALDARRDATTLIIARTDALSVEGFEAALSRADAYANAGADALFIEGPRDMDQMRAIGHRFATLPLIHNLVEGGNSPIHSLREAEALGFKITLHPAFLVHLFAKVAPVYLQRLACDGSSREFREELLDLEGINSILGAAQLLQESQRYA
jgi:2-methylisocitrate lyase-like PEP mutase family enzyme